MELTQYLIQILIAAGIFTVLCILAKPLKKIIDSYFDSHLNHYFPLEEILTLK
ncbi:hypothetical protein [Methanobrevibacter sp.]|uniref:hypothetical protein n=1 Tax=Methanobrevibacter sp. TaxID=66852 RepID=UPI0038908A30